MAFRNSYMLIRRATHNFCHLLMWCLLLLHYVFICFFCRVFQFWRAFFFSSVVIIWLIFWSLFLGLLFYLVAAVVVFATPLLLLLLALSLSSMKWIARIQKKVNMCNVKRLFVFHSYWFLFFLLLFFLSQFGAHRSLPKIKHTQKTNE